MNRLQEFSPEVTRKLKYYVYLYIDPTTDEVFYVGKGRGNRAFAHLADPTENDKRRRIEAIRKAGSEPVVEILVHGLQTEEEAYRVEAAVIDLLGTDRLTNSVRGWRSGSYGRMTAEQIEAQYGAPDIEVAHPAILIRINQLFRYGMSAHELYEATRGHWVVGQRREGVELAMAVFEGIVQEVYRVAAWFPAGSTFLDRGHGSVDPARWEFVGRVADESVRGRYRFKSVRQYVDGLRNPILYVNVV